MLARDDNGVVLAAEYSVVEHDGHLDLILESAGGASANRAARNTDYRATLGVLLARLRDLEAIIEDAVVDSRYTREVAISAADRRLLDGPIHLVDVGELDDLRLQLTSRQIHVGQAPSAIGGNSTKRIRLTLTVPQYGAGDAGQLAERLARPLPVLELPPEAFVIDGSHRLAGLAAALAEPPQARIEDVLEAFRNLTVRYGPDSLAKRHQPLTLLWSIGRAWRGRQRLVPWPLARAQIGQLIRDHGQATDRPNPDLPFLALAGSGLWELTAVPPRGLSGTARRRWLDNASPVVRGGLTEPVAWLFATSEDAARLAIGVLLEDHFDVGQREGVLSAVGLERLAGGLRPSPAPGRPGGFLSPFKPRADADYVSNVAGGPFPRSRKHETLVNDFANWLSHRGLEAASNAAIDLGLVQPPVIIEAKVVRAGRWATAIREAIGQLYEYRYFQVVAPESELLFLASAEIPQRWLDYLDEDRQIGAAWRAADGFQMTSRARAALTVEP